MVYGLDPCSETEAHVIPAAGSAGCWWFTGVTLPSVCLQPKEAASPKVMSPPGRQQPSNDYSVQENRAQSLCLNSAHLWRDTSFHISPWDQPIWQLHHSSDSYSTQSCFPQSLTVLLPKLLSDHPPLTILHLRICFPGKLTCTNLLAFWSFIFCRMSIYILLLFLFLLKSWMFKIFAYSSYQSFIGFTYLLNYFHLFANYSWHYNSILDSGD